MTTSVYSKEEVDALLKTVNDRLNALQSVPPVVPPVDVPPTAPSGIVTRVGNEMMRNGIPWRPKGANAQTLTHGDSLLNAERLFKLFPKGSLFRCFFLANPRSPMSVSFLQAVVALAKTHGQYLLIALSNGAYSEANNDPWRDGIKDAAYYTGGWKAQLIPHFDRVVKPLAGATNIIWQNMNEIGQSGGIGGDNRIAIAREFQHATCSEIKSRAPNHLVFGGVQDAYAGRFVQNAVEFAAVHNSPAIDGAGVHEYEAKIPYRQYGVYSRFNDIKREMDSLGKVLIVAEYGVGDGGSSAVTAAVRADRARQKTVAYRTAGAKCSMIWAVAEPWNRGEPTTGEGAWERVDSPVLKAIIEA